MAALGATAGFEPRSEVTQLRLRRLALTAVWSTDIPEVRAEMGLPQSSQ